MSRVEIDVGVKFQDGRLLYRSQGECTLLLYEYNIGVLSFMKCNIAGIWELWQRSCLKLGTL